MKTSSEIARQTLRLLARRRLEPTPENYHAIYSEASGQPTIPQQSFPTERFENIIHVLPARTPAQKRLLEQLRTAVHKRDWAALQAVWVAYANLANLHHPNEAHPAASEPPAPVESPPNPRPQPQQNSSELEYVYQCVPKPVAEQISLLAKHLTVALGEDDLVVLNLARQVQDFFRQECPAIKEGSALLKNFAYRLSFAAQDQADIRLILLQLLNLGLENVCVLSLEDKWLQGQIQAVQEAATPPLSLRSLQKVRVSLEELIVQQAEAKHKLLQAQEQMKELLAIFIDRLAQMDDSSVVYQLQLEECTQRIQSASALYEITPVLQEIIAATQAVSQSNRQVRSELEELRQRSAATHAEITQLRKELEQTSALARRDMLTGALNRTGFDEAVARATERSSLLNTSLCVALLDLDNFKALNDRLGHSTGDRALQHLVRVIEQVMREQDQIARYGGEEFVLLLPQTSLDEAANVMRRLQRELTRRYFLEGNERILITFSAGVTEMRPGETHEAALRRADEAMYQAKRSGKNQVVAI